MSNSCEERNYITNLSDYQTEAGCLKRYTGTHPCIVLPEDVKALESFAFGSCATVQAVVIPEGVEKLGDRAFSACENLTDVYLPDSLSAIGRNVYGSDDPGARIKALRKIVHGE